MIRIMHKTNQLKRYLFYSIVKYRKKKCSTIKSCCFFFIVVVWFFVMVFSNASQYFENVKNEIRIIDDNFRQKYSDTTKYESWDHECVFCRKSEIREWSFSCIEIKWNHYYFYTTRNGKMAQKNQQILLTFLKTASLSDEP